MTAVPAQVNRATASASVCARGTSESTTRYSSGECALPPTGPTAQIVGVPTPAVKPEYAQPTVNSASIFRARFLAQEAQYSNSRLLSGPSTSGLNSPAISSVALVAGTLLAATMR